VAGAVSRGVNCQFGVKVEKFAYTELKDSNLRHCTHIYTTQEPLETDFLILCAGIGVTPLTSSLAVPIDVRPVLGQALQIKLSSSVESEAFQPVLTGNDVHIVPVGRGEYWIGATVEFMRENGEIIPEKKLLEEVYQQAIAYYPALAFGEIVRTWSGLRPRPENKSAPVIEYLPNYDNVILATGHYRNGVLLAPATAKTVREMILAASPNH
jgi:glycine/D-amino acid oxidase-like deaminating enzyme